MSGSDTVRVAWAREGEWTAHDLLLAEAGRLTGVPVDELRVVSSCPRCGGSGHGRPLLRSATGRPVPHVSLSRAPGVVVVALTGAGPVGVDVERRGGAGFDGFDEVALHPAERADGPVERTVTWVRKESLLKAAGHGLAVDLRSVRLTGPRRPPAVLAWDQPPAREGLRPWMYDVPDAVPGYTVAVTVLGRDRPALVTGAAPRAARAAPSPPARR